MTFFSGIFPLFLIAALLLYYCLPGRIQWLVLLAVSIVFYAWSGPAGLSFLVFTVVTTYAAGILLDTLAKKNASRRMRRIVLAAALLMNFGLLYLLKYRTNTIRGFLPDGMLMPMGISFYMFQSMGYLIDCYRKKYAAERNILRLALFVSFFPQLIQGPISRYDQLGKQFSNCHPFNADELKYGIQRILWGYLKKMIIADRAAVLVNSVYASLNQYGGMVYAVAVLFYSVQLYCDFSGGIDITIGTAQLFGITLPENFRRPIFAVSLADYWRRWHITLGAWMRDYVFYPLALSAPVGALGRFIRKKVNARAGKLVSTALSTFVVYIIIGIWHGSGMRYLVFGLWNGCIITLSLLLSGFYSAVRKRFDIRDSASFRAFQMIRTAVIVLFGRYITRAPALDTAFDMLKKTFLRPGFNQVKDGVLLHLGLGATDLLVIGVGVMTILFVEYRQEKGTLIRRRLEEMPPFLQWLLIAAPLVLLLFFGIYSGKTIAVQFIYQQF